jgi:hypothetical protein
MLKGRTVKATVEFSGEFPLDMLRYDQCYPDQSSDVAVIADSMDWNRHGAGRKTLTLAKFAESGRREPWTAGRWKSFGCKLEPIEER